MSTLETVEQIINERIDLLHVIRDKEEKEVVRQIQGLQPYHAQGEMIELFRTEGALTALSSLKVQMINLQIQEKLNDR